MAGSVLVDAGFLVALLSRRDTHHRWAAAEGPRFPPPWHTSEAALSEAFHLLGGSGDSALNALLTRGAVVVAFDLARDLDPVLVLIQKYRSVPMSLADACLVRMSETFPDPTVLTTDTDFRVYRRHGRQVVPCRSHPLLTRPLHSVRWALASAVTISTGLAVLNPWSHALTHERRRNEVAGHALPSWSLGPLIAVHKWTGHAQA